MKNMEKSSEQRGELCTTPKNWTKYLRGEVQTRNVGAGKV